MSRPFASIAALALLAVASAPLTGCIIGECDNGQDNCVKSESTIQYTGKASSQSAAYSAGQNVSIDSALGDIQVKVGSGSEVSVTFNPFTRNTDDDDGKQKATDEINDKLVISVTEGDTVQVKVGRKSGSTNFLGANVVVTLPASFDGDFTARPGAGDFSGSLGGATPASTHIISDLGDIEVSGARGDLEITTDNGDIDLKVSAWAAAGDGKVVTGLGDISITVPSDANGTLTLKGEDEINSSGLPSDWESAENDAGISFTMGTGEGAHVEVFTDSAFGTITATSN